MIVRPAKSGDSAAIAAIWNPVIRDGIETFNSVEKSALDVAALIDAKNRDGHGFFVVASENRILGFAYYGQFRGGAGYARTFEHTVYVDIDAGGQGVGRALLAAVEDHARAAGGHVIFAGVSAENHAGIAFHRRLGYTESARLQEVGRKFGTWHDLVLMRKMLS